MAKDTKPAAETSETAESTDQAEPAVETAPVENVKLKALEAKIETQGYVTTAQAERLRELRQLAI